MISATVPGDVGTFPPSRPRPPVSVGRRAVLGGVVSLAVGASLRPSAAVGATSLAAGPSPAAGATLYSYGHSLTMMPSRYVTVKTFDEYQLQLGRRLASGPVISRGRSGTSLLDTISAIVAPTFAGSSFRRWRIGDRGIILLHNMMTDAASQSGGDADYLNAYEKALRLALGVFGARSFIHADLATRVGSWTVSGSPRIESGRTWSSQTYGDKITFRITGGDSAHVSTMCTDPVVLAQGTLRAECNGKVLGYFGRGPDNGTYACNRAKSHIDSVDDVTSSQWTPAGWRVVGLNAAAGTSGTKTLTVRKVNNTAAPVWVQGVYLPSSHAPRVLVAKEAPRNPGAASQPSVDAFYRNEPRYRALIDAVCTEYAAAYSVDLRPGWDNATMVSVLDTSHRFHPNTLGMSCIADNFEQAVNRYVTATSPGLH